jgi:hypothetical protein
MSFHIASASLKLSQCDLIKDDLEGIKFELPRIQITDIDQKVKACHLVSNGQNSLIIDSNFYTYQNNEFIK